MDPGEFYELKIKGLGIRSKGLKGFLSGICLKIQ